MTEFTLETHTQHSDQPASNPSKSLLMGYGLLSYLLGFSGLMAMILSMGGLLPMGGWITLTTHPLIAIIINILLTGLFGVQHSVMARPRFKAAFSRLFGTASERATFVWSSGVTLMLVLALWQTVPGQLWAFESTPALIVMWTLFALGWTYLFAATFAINHFDLFGLRQIWFAMQNRPYEPPVFKENWMYRYSRHPIMLGALAGMWFLPEMSATKLVMTLTMTAYIFIGVMFEERDLIRAFGQHYVDYKRRVGMFFTLGKRN